MHHSTNRLIRISTGTALKALAIVLVAAVAMAGAVSADVAWRWRIDGRVVSGTEHKPMYDLMAVEVEGQGSVGDRWEFALQIPLYTMMEGRGRDMHFGLANATLKGKLGRPTYKFGNFVIPFGNLVDYETHSTILQAMYYRSLGLRIDAGVEIEGYFGTAPWQLAVTQGSGPYRKDLDSYEVVTFRASQVFELGADELRAGLSLLRGKLPAYSVMSDPLMDANPEFADPDRPFAMKNRVGLDLEYYFGTHLLRAEIVGGTDDGDAVFGHWLQLKHPFSYSTELELMQSAWHQPEGSEVRWGIGLQHKLREDLTVGLAYQRARTTAESVSMRHDMGTLQIVYQF